jgi:hypothetical protein
MLDNSGTLNEPLLTIHVLVLLPVLVTHVPDPEKLPVAFVVEMEEIVTVPEVIVQNVPGVVLVELKPA